MASFTLEELAQRKGISAKTLSKYLKEDNFQKQTRGRVFSETEAYAIAENYDFSLPELNGSFHPKAAILAKVFPNMAKKR